MRLPRITSTATLIAAFVLSTVSFIVATAVSAELSNRIGGMANEIATNSLPASFSVDQMRTSARHVDALLMMLVANRAPPGGFAPPTEVLASETAALEELLGTYVASPAFPREAALRPLVLQRWQEVRRAQERVLALVEEGRFDDVFRALVEDYSPAFDRFDEALVASISANVEETTDRARRIAADWQRARSVELVLMTGSVVFTLVAAVLAIRAIRRSTRLLAERAEESEQFAGRVAHDVLSPLTPVRMFLDLAQRRGLDHPSVERALPGARAAVTRIVDTVDGLLAFAKAGARAQEGDQSVAAEIVRGVVEDQRVEAEARRVELRALDVVEARVRCAPGVLSSVLSNLVRNALKYMGDARERRVTVSARALDARVRFEVADTGPGIAPEWQGRIFDPLVRLPAVTEQGIGLGLATVRRLVERHGGQVGLVSAPGRGSRFWFTLPLAGGAGRRTERLRRRLPWRAPPPQPPAPGP